MSQLDPLSVCVSLTAEKVSVDRVQSAALLSVAAPRLEPKRTAMKSSAAEDSLATTG
ncbi:hypothetical protein [Shinella kummerowiae]|uniref:hypothetical protein n=1 Tax=Shinella kummerowiae TaxID=417745 RepID=UPI0021B5C3B8|nr:hypothetical protein [Shinella kummerowiae]MCT7666092.1 hypothetical protein [Shinella kummerowiae]